MNYQTYIFNNLNIHILKDDRFHTIVLRTIFTENVDKRKITYRNFLADILTFSCMKYKTNMELTKKMQDLYSTKAYASVNRFGNLLCTRFTISVINSLYINNDNLYDNIELLGELLFNPLINNNEFDLKTFNIIKESQILDVKTISEDARLYSNIRLLDIMKEKDKNYSLVGYSDLNIIDEITPKNLYEEYQKMIHESRIDVFIAGDIKNFESVITKVKSCFKIKSSLKLVNPYIMHDREILKPIVLSEKKNYLQSKLSIGYTFLNLSEYETRYVLPIFCILLGGDSNSLLMQHVRGNNSLVYYIYAYYNKLDNIMVINSGITKDNYEKILDLINAVIDLIINGKFSKMELSKSINNYLMELKGIENGLGELIDYHFGMELFNTNDLRTRINEVKKITKNDIMAIAKKINMRAIYLLEGEK